MDHKNSNINSNANRKPKNKKNKKRRNKNRQSTNGIENNKFPSESPTSNSNQDENQQASNPRPGNLMKNNFNSDNKRCSGSEIEEFHTPNCEYPGLTGQDYDKEWNNICDFSRLNLEKIPEKEQDHNSKIQNHIINDHKLPEISSENSFKYKKISYDRKHLKCNGEIKNKHQIQKFKAERNVVINNLITNDKIHDIEDRKFEHAYVNGTKDVEDINGSMEYQDPQEESQNDIIDFKDNNTETNVFEKKFEDDIDESKTVDQEIYYDCTNDIEHQNGYVGIDDAGITEKTSNNEDHDIVEENHGDINNEKPIYLEENQSKIDEIVQDDENIEDKISIHEDKPTEEMSISITLYENNINTVDNDAEHINEASKTNEEHGHDYFKDDIMENIHCIDENLEETLQAPIIKMNIQYKNIIKKSLTLGSRDMNNSHRQSATTITNVTSISDENLNMSHESDLRKFKNGNKRNKFVRILFSKFKKPKQNSKTDQVENKISTDDSPLPMNNEYFDDASIDCNSHGKGCEIDSNKALQSYDELINNFGETKQIEEEYFEKFVINDKINIENEFDCRSSEGVCEIENICFEKSCSPMKESLQHQSDGEKSNSIKLLEKENPLEKPKKNKIFTIFSRKKNKHSPKFRLADITNEQPRKNYNCCENKIDINDKEEKKSTSKGLNEENKEIKIVIENQESVTNELIEDSVQVSDLNRDIESFDKSFEFLKDFEKEPVREDVDTDTNRDNDVIEDINLNTNDNLKSDESKDSCSLNVAPIAKVNDTNPNFVPSSPVKIRTQDKFAEVNSPSANNVKEKNEKAKKKNKKHIIPSFLNRKSKSLRKDSKPCSGGNTEEDEKASTLKNRKLKLDDETIDNFNQVLKSFENDVCNDVEKVVSKNNNGYSLTFIDNESVEDKTISYINDDHLFPDALTPSKIVQFDSRNSYDFPFIDDPVIVKQDHMIMFKGESKKPLLFTKFTAPFASSETLFIPENSEELKMPEKSLSPTRRNKSPFSGLMDLISRSR